MTTPTSPALAADTSRPELLAPAGGIDALRAAVGAGADAIYLGLAEFNARRGADNFTLETLGEACRFAHLHGRRVYLTLNVVILPHEMPSAIDTVDSAWEAGIDAVIVQDLGLLRAISLALPHVRIHASTQLNTHGSDTIGVLAKSGVSRVTLSRETSLAEISALCSKARDLGVEVESFVHGALCICYSGQCLLSSLVGGRSANRGMCAQPCRLPYELMDDAGMILGDVGAHLLSPKDLAGIAVLPGLVASGVDSLKIEGRMKSPEYVALVTGVYREALDRALAAPEVYEVRDGERSVLSEAFSRGFSEAYLVGERGNDMMSYHRPNNRGVPVGRVVSASGGEAVLALDKQIDAEDTIQFWTSQGHFTQRAGILTVNGKQMHQAPAGVRASVRVEKPATTGDRVFRVRNAALSEAAARTFENVAGPAIPLAFHVSMVTGSPLCVEVTDTRGLTGSATGPEVEAARTKAITAEEISGHVGRLGGTPYIPASWSIDLSPGAGGSYSMLHKLRRAALDDYEARVLAPWEGRESTLPKEPRLPEHYRRPADQRVRLTAVARDLESAYACFEAGADEVQVSTVALQGEQHLPAWLVPMTPRVSHDFERESLLAPALSAKRAVAGTLGALERLAGQGVEVESHWSLNALNAHAVAKLAEIGASLVWLSPELSLEQVAKIAEKAAAPLGVAVAGRQELMVTEHCVLMSEGPCSQQCESCRRRQGVRLLKDRKGYKFPVVTDARGRTHLYNAVPLDVTTALAELFAAGVSAVRIDVESDAAESAGAQVARAAQALKSALLGKAVEKSQAKTTTTGHFFRGVS